MIDDSTKNSIESYLRDVHDRSITITYHADLQLGTFNRTCLIDTSVGRYFLKHNKKDQYPAIFEKEAKGLKLIRSTETINAPEVIFYDHTSSEAFILLEHIEPSRENDTFWGNFGRALAKLHKRSNEYFGLDYDNYIGPFHQINSPHELWTDFFAEERLERLIKKARDAKIIEKEMVSGFDNLYPQLSKIFPPEPPALLHGNLWEANYIVNPENQPYVIDPAVYYGHREMDIAMTRLFGQYSERFYEAYTEEYPLEEDWKERMDIYNLYPLLVLLHLLGEEYIKPIKKILKHYS
ncbi:MAG: fructosamine kinase family protein [Bacteroidales bacterium]|nr:fructosamine kinase family protein [Bacteroidales bacterium]